MKAEYCHEAVSVERKKPALTIENLFQGFAISTTHSVDISVEIWTVYRTFTVSVH